MKGLAKRNNKTRGKTHKRKSRGKTTRKRKSRGGTGFDEYKTGFINEEEKQNQKQKEEAEEAREAKGDNYIDPNGPDTKWSPSEPQDAAAM